jgi:hypothetical protein
MDIGTQPRTDRQRRRPTADGLLFGAAGFVPIVAGAAVAGFGHDGLRDGALHLTVIWSGAILAFLAGVRRGLSFDQPGGARVGELATMFWLFVLAAAALMVPAPAIACILLILGYASLALLDTRAARSAEAPRFFAALRPVQSAAAVAALAALLALRLAT